MNGFSGADVVQLLREGLIASQLQEKEKISKQDLLDILKDMQPSGLKDILLKIPR